MLKLFMKNQKGFTLVELMVVVVIIGILTAIAVPIYNKTQDTARTNANQANLRTLNSAISMYMADNTEATLPASSAAWKTALEGKYIQVWPVAPTGFSAYIIDVTTPTNPKAVNTP